ncbi:MAG: allophanate hydrolase-related protein [Desulfitobacteriaceae bacterium]
MKNEVAKPKKNTVLVAVCGLHMRGYPLEKQMLEYEALFIREALTAPRYQLFRLATTPEKPGLLKSNTREASIQIEIWEMPLTKFGEFVSTIPSPLGIGKIELLDGTEIAGFICEAYACESAENITSAGSWRNI